MRRRALRIFRRALFCGNCHCRDCQRASDGAYFPALGVPADALKITGEPKYYESAADSGCVIRGFYPNCGARLFAKSSVNLTVIEIYAGSLDDPSIPNPQRLSTRPARSRGTTLIQSC